MPEQVDLVLLRNCTLLSVNKFPWTTTLNDTGTIANMNLTDVIDLISGMIDEGRHLDDDSIKYVLVKVLNIPRDNKSDGDSNELLLPGNTSTSASIRPQQFATSCLSNRRPHGVCYSASCSLSPSRGTSLSSGLFWVRPK